MMNKVVFYISLIIVWFGCSKEDIPENEIVAALDGNSAVGNQVEYIADDELLLTAVETRRTSSGGVIFKSALRGVNCLENEECPIIEFEFEIDKEEDINDFLNSSEIDIASPQYSIFNIVYHTNGEFTDSTSEFDIGGNGLVDGTGYSFITNGNRLDYLSQLRALGFDNLEGEGRQPSFLYECDFGFNPFEISYSETGGFILAITNDAIENYDARWVNLGHSEEIEASVGNYAIEYYCESTKSYHLKEIMIVDSSEYLYTTVTGEVFDSVEYDMDLSVIYNEVGFSFNSDWVEDREVKMKIKENHDIMYLGQNYHILKADLSIELRTFFNLPFYLELKDVLIYLQAID